MLLGICRPPKSISPQYMQFMQNWEEEQTECQLWRIGKQGIMVTFGLFQFFIKPIRDLQTGGRGRVPVRVYRTEHAHKVWRPTFFEVRVLRTENSYSQSSSSSDLKVPIDSWTFLQKMRFWTFWCFLSQISAKLALIRSKMRLQHNSLAFLPPASRFTTL